jgi:hypothetical protein
MPGLLVMIALKIKSRECWRIKMAKKKKGFIARLWDNLDKKIDEKSKDKKCCCCKETEDKEC